MFKISVAAGTSTLLVGAGCAGAVPAEQETEAVGSTSSAYTVAAPGSATLELGWVYAPTGERYGFFVRSSTTDEFVRAGETLRLAVPAYVAWYALYPDLDAPDAARMQQLTIEARVSFKTGGAEVGAATAVVSSWSGGDVYNLQGTTASFVVPAGVDALDVDFAFGDTQDPAKRATLGGGDTAALPVIGGRVPAKTVLFDNNYGAYRRRTLEGGAPVAGAELTLGYTDWRADQRVDRYAIDRNIGSTTGYGRFGAYTYAILGELVHEVSYGIYFDDGRGWQAEQQLAARAGSPLVGNGRTSYETTLRVPAGARRMSVYFHVKTYLVANYASYPSATHRRYAEGERVLVRERWDNPSGAFTNYDYDLEAR